MKHLLRSLALCSLLVGLTSLFLSLAPPELGEPLPLRWLRALASHPIRGTLALALALPWKRPHGSSGTEPPTGNPASAGARVETETISR